MKKISLIFQYFFAFFIILVVNSILIFLKLLKKAIGIFLLLFFLIPIIVSLLLALLLQLLIVKFLSKKKKVIKEFKINNHLASIIILNWNGEKFIKKCLDSVLEAVKYSKKPHEIILVDNGSTDNSLEIVKDYSSSIKIIKLDKNYYYSGGNNAGIKAAKHDIVVLLNNDMIVDKNFLNPLLKHFDKKDLFSVACQIFFQDPKKRREETGRTKGEFKNGFIKVWHDNINKNDKNFDAVLYGGGGAAAFNKKMLLHLGGIDEIWNPFYWEDTDISFKAWRRGWFSIVEPQSIVYHKHQATTKANFTEKFINEIKERNRYLFHWIHLLDSFYLIQHLFFLPIYLSRNFLIQGKDCLIPFFLAIKKLPLIFKRRAKEIKEKIYKDKEIFLYANNLFYFREIKPELFPKDKKSKKLNILYVCPYVPSLFTHAGAGRMYQVIKMMSQLGHKVSVLSFANNEEEAKLTKYLKPFCQEIKVIVRHPVLDCRNFLKFNFVNNDFYDPNFEKELLNLLNKIDFDIVDYQYFQTTPYIKKSRRVVNFFTDHENIYLTHKRSKSKNLFVYFSILKRLSYILRLIDCYISVTQIDAEAIKKLFPSAEPIVHNTGVDMDYYKRNLKIKEKDNNLVYIGYYQHTPNRDAVLYFVKNIFPIVLTKKPNSHFYIVGKDPSPEILALNNKNITVTGFVPDTRPYIDQASIVVVPIRIGAGIREKILKCWAMKKAIITTSIGCQGLKVENGKNIIIADEPNKFATSIIYLMNNYSKRKELGEQGYLTVKKYYSWEIKIRELEQLYLKIYQKKYDSFFYS